MVSPPRDRPLASLDGRVVVVVVPDPNGDGVQAPERVRAGEVHEELGRLVALLAERELELRRY
ncbi:hypothetical protein [Streptomyces sp. NPDC058701]|uniref:hypothetical protein n=1 Tax=Streptomyces sp. NPDC058701 TaxID=3346608 RepID=UPI0036689F80